MRSSGSVGWGCLSCEEPRRGMPASHKTNVITAAGKWRLGIPGVSVVFFIDDAMAQRAPTTAVQKRRALLSLSVEAIWQADERGLTILRPVKKRSRGLNRLRTNVEQRAKTVPSAPKPGH